MAALSGLNTYIIRGGKEGRARLSVLARLMAPTTGELLDGLGSMRGLTVVDVGCGGGDVTFDLARRAGPEGHVHGLDLDGEKVASARQEAEERGFANVVFHEADIMATWPVGGADVAYARFIFTHVTDPVGLARRAIDALKPGGLLVVEDVDFDGLFCHPPCDAFERFRKLYTAAGQKRGADPLIGRKLGAVLEEAGACDVDMSLVQPFGRTGEVKEISVLTLAAISDSLVAEGLAMREEVEALAAELGDYAARPDTLMSAPRIFRAWGRTPAG